MRIKANMTSHTKSKRRCRAVWPVKRVRPSAPSKLMCRSFALVFCSSITPVIYAAARPPRRYGRERHAPLMARAPKTFNFFINQPLVQTLGKTYRHWLICHCCRSPRYNNKWWASLGNMHAWKHDAVGLKLSMQSRKRARCWWCRTLYQLLRCASGGGFCPSG